MPIMTWNIIEENILGKLKFLPDSTCYKSVFYNSLFYVKELLNSSTHLVFLKNGIYSFILAQEARKHSALA